MNVVIDTNVFISGIFWKGAPSKILNLWKDETIVIITTTLIINELCDVLRHFKIKLPEEDIYNWRSMIIHNSILMDDDLLHNYPVRDKSDNKFLQCAALSRA